MEIVVNSFNTILNHVTFLKKITHFLIKKNNSFHKIFRLLDFLWIYVFWDVLDKILLFLENVCSIMRNHS